MKAKTFDASFHHSIILNNCFLYLFNIFVGCHCSIYQTIYQNNIQRPYNVYYAQLLILILVECEHDCFLKMTNFLFQMQNPMQVKPADSEVKSGTIFCIHVFCIFDIHQDLLGNVLVVHIYTSEMLFMCPKDISSIANKCCYAITSSVFHIKAVPLF